MKTMISYVSGSGGDFVVNCCNHAWNSLLDQGNVIPSASAKQKELILGNAELISYINELPYDYVGSHSVDRLLSMPFRTMWLVVPDYDQLWIWTARDCVTRSSDNLMGRHGSMYEQIHDLIHSGQLQHAAELYLDWLNNYNWTLMQMRLVQPTNKIDTCRLLQPLGINYVIDQLPELELTADQCRLYHKSWLEQQLPLTDRGWILDCVATKLQKLVNGH